MTGENIDKYLTKYGNHIKLLSTTTIVITFCAAVVGGYIWYRSNIWKPTVSVVDVDFNNAVAHIIINGTRSILYGNDILACGGLWGVKFGTTGTGTASYDTIQLVQSGLVYDILKTK